MKKAATAIEQCFAAGTFVERCPYSAVPGGFDTCEAVRRHTKCRGKNVTTRWQDVARDLFAENTKLRAENERRKKRMQWYENRLADYAGNA